MRPALPQVLLIAATACSGGPQDSTPPTTGEPVPDPGAELVEHGAVTCRDPVSREGGPWARLTSPSPEADLAWIYGGGAIAGDLDGDGRLDVVAPNFQPQADVYLGTGGDWFAERDDVLAGHDLSHGTGGTAVDYDGDGDLDLYITRYTKPNVLLRNEGALRFTDVTAEAGVAACDPDGTCFRSLSSTWADADRDGDLDLVVGNYGYVPHDGTLAPDMDPGEPSFFYLNEGDGRFVDATEEVMPRQTLPQVHEGYTYVASFLDLDRDGWPELYFINDFGTAYPNVLLWNDGGSFVPDAGAHGLDQPMTGMCLGVHDRNGDGLPDLLISEWNKLTLLESSEFGVWISVQTGALGLVPRAPQKVPWGCEHADVDLDGDEDLIQAFGYVRNDGTAAWTNPLQQPDALYVQGDDGTFVDFGAAWGLDDAGVGRGFVVGDFNRDGYPDLFKRDPKGPDVTYASRCGTGSWLVVDLRQPGTLNTHAVGAVVEVDVGGRTLTRWVMAGGRNFASAPPLEVHFGLGDADRIDGLRVSWPDGAVSEWGGLPARQRLTISRRSP